MLIPLGFGNWPRKTPVFTLFLCLLTTAIAIKYFPVIKELNKITEAELQKLKDQRKDLMADLIYKSCQVRFGENPICEKEDDYEFPQNKDRKRQVANLETETEKVKKDVDIRKTTSKFIDYVQYLTEFKKPVEQWPEESKGFEEYLTLKRDYEESRSVILNAYREAGFLNKDNFVVPAFLISTFSHGNFYHLISNLLLILLMGVWVEQRVGGLRTALIFFLGSFIGMAAETMIQPHASVLGASAGAMSLLGAFFVFFYKTEIQFVFSFFPFYFRRIDLPAIWTFPFFFLLTDFLVVGKATGVAHYAHIFGMISGMIMAFVIKKEQALPEGQLFTAEGQLLQDLENAQNPKELWRAFEEIMEWNCQNREALRLFLLKAEAMQWKPGNLFEHNFLERHLRRNTNLVFRRSETSKIKEWLYTLPEYVLKKGTCLADVPLSQMLFLADSLAQENRFVPAGHLYQIAMTKKPDPIVQQKIEIALTTIEGIKGASQ